MPPADEARDSESDLESLVPTQHRLSFGPAVVPEVPAIIVGMPILSVGLEVEEQKPKTSGGVDDDWQIPSERD